MFTYSCGTPAFTQSFAQPAYAPVATSCGGFGGNFAFILVLFILLAIITSPAVFGGGRGIDECCEPRCFG